MSSDFFFNALKSCKNKNSVERKTLKETSTLSTVQKELYKIRFGNQGADGIRRRPGGRSGKPDNQPVHHKTDET